MPIDCSNAWNTGVRIINQFIAFIPNFVIACIIFLVFLVIAWFCRTLVRRVAVQRRKHQGIALLLARLVHVGIVILGFLVALSLIAPSFQASDDQDLGIGSVAVGFAFQNILQNFLAGILLLLQEPFRIGDWISVTGIEGKVYDIQSRATVITTKGGARSLFRTPLSSPARLPSNIPPVRTRPKLPGAAAGKTSSRPRSHPLRRWVPNEFVQLQSQPHR